MADNYNDRSNDQIAFTLVEELGVLSTHNSGWNREVNIVSWNGRPAKIDIRDWEPGHERMSKGITLREDEALRMAEILIGRLGPYGRRRRGGQAQQQTRVRNEQQNSQRNESQFRQRDERQYRQQSEAPTGFEEVDNYMPETAEMGAAKADSLWDEPEDKRAEVQAETEVSVDAEMQMEPVAEKETETQTETETVTDEFGYEERALEGEQEEVRDIAA